MVGQGVERQDAAVVQVRDVFETGKLGDQRPGARVEVDGLAAQDLVTHTHLVGTHQFAVARIEVDQGPQPRLETRALVGPQRVHPGHDLGKVDTPRADLDAEVRRRPGDVRHPGRRHQRLGGRCTPVDAGAPTLSSSITATDCPRAFSWGTRVPVACPVPIQIASYSFIEFSPTSEAKCEIRKVRAARDPSVYGSSASMDAAASTAQRRKVCVIDEARSAAVATLVVFSW